MQPKAAISILKDNARAAPTRGRRAVETRFARIQAAPIIVLGNHKSGTSAITALLGHMTGLTWSVDFRRELKGAKYLDVAEGRMSFDEFMQRNRLDFSRDIVKENHLTTMYDDLRVALPDSKVVLIVRDPRDNNRSLLNRLSIPGNLSVLDAQTWARVPRVWKLVLDGRWLGLDGANYIEMLAQRWNLTSDVFLRHPGDVILQRYEDFLEDKTGATERLATRLGLERRRDIASRLDRAYQPRGDQNISWSDFYGPVNLQRIEAICAERMEQLGYPASNR